MSEKRTRKPKYDIGYEDARRHALLILSTLIDNYPNEPSEFTMRSIGDIERTRDIEAPMASCLRHFASKLAKASRKKVEAVA